MSLSKMVGQNFDYMATGLNYSPGEYGISGKGIGWLKNWGIGGETTVSYNTKTKPKYQDGLNFSVIAYPAFPLNKRGLAIEAGAGVFVHYSLNTSYNSRGMDLHVGLDYKHQYLPLNLSLGWNPRLEFSSELNQVENKDNNFILRYPYIAIRIQTWGEYKHEVLKGAKSGKLKKSKLF